MLYAAAVACVDAMTPDEIAEGRTFPKIDRIREVSHNVAVEVIKVALDSGLTNGQILGAAINRVHGIVANASAGRTRMAMWADMIVPDHNGGANYSWLSGGGRRQPYWPAA